MLRIGLLDCFLFAWSPISRCHGFKDAEVEHAFNSGKGAGFMERAGFVQYGKAITVFGCIGIELPVTKNNNRSAALLPCRGNFFL